jgi:hypothetical protein
MKNLFTFSLLLLTNFIFSQNRFVNVNDPISEVDISYSEPTGMTRLTVILNTVETNEASAVSADYSAQMNIEGSVKWDVLPTDPKKNILKNVPLNKQGTDKPFVFFVDLYTADNQLLMKSSPSNLWNKIALKLHYVINGVSGHTTTVNLYPPTIGSTPIYRKLSIETQAKQKETKKGVLSFKSEPSGIPFEIKELKITKKIGENETSTTLSATDLGVSRYSYNGELNVEVPTSFEIENLGNKYLVVCKAVLLGDSNISLNSSVTEVVFVQDFDLRILNRTSTHSISVIGDSNEFIDGNIETEGNGTLGIRFLNSNYQNIKSTVAKVDGSKKYDIKLTGLNAIPNETSSTFYYTNGAKDISAPLTISKKLPRVTDFRFDGLSGDALNMSFKLLGTDEGTMPVVKIAEGLNNIELGGSLIVNPDVNDKTKFNISIARNISNILTGEEIVTDISISVNYASNSLYDLKVTVFNQKLYDEKMKKLREETDKKKKDRDAEKIKSLVEEISSYGKAAGKVIESEEIKVAVENLQNGKSDKVKEVMSDVGKWALVVGKIILPLLAV